MTPDQIDAKLKELWDDTGRSGGQGEQYGVDLGNRT